MKLRELHKLAFLAIVFAAAELAIAAGSPTTLEEPTQEAQVAPSLDEGWSTYQRYCQNCHGDSGRGDGRIAHLLKRPPADLTLLSERNDGSFPRERAAEIIDGRKEIGSHGLREMPVWGNIFGDGEEVGDGGEAVRGEEAVRAKIAALVAVLEWIDKSVEPAEDH